MFKPNVHLKYVMEVEDLLIKAVAALDEVQSKDILDGRAQYAISQIQKMIHAVDHAIISERYVMMNTFEAAKDNQKELLNRSEQQRLERLEGIKERAKEEGSTYIR
jgi:hypothetical protein